MCCSRDFVVEAKLRIKAFSSSDARHQRRYRGSEIKSVPTVNVGLLSVFAYASREQIKDVRRRLLLCLCLHLIITMSSRSFILI